MEKLEFKIIFWGVRGSMPVPGPSTLKYGGNTPCVQVQIGEKLIILDAGTGICNLGKELIKKNTKITGHIFITHVHWDHIHGIPFFLPVYKKGNHFRVFGERKGDMGFKELMSLMMKAPYFPVEMDAIGDQIEICDIEAGQRIQLSPGIVIKTERNNHPNGGISYRIEHGGRSFCYVTDTEHYKDTIDPLLKNFIEGADIVIYDANYTDEEYNGLCGNPSRTGWGHSTWQEGIKLVRAAGAKKLVLFHHNSDRTDKELDIIDAQARDVYPDCVTAYEGMQIIL
ncbi:MAG TPA: MBL fold metallo-hydrolase [Clostridiaceae bacterium]|nr:MBL fold metallo-hydrolase [Clostridiaceae bacterium]